MGSCFFCRPSSSSTTSMNICVVHLNGYVENFEHAITVRQITGNPPKYCICTRTQLLSPGSKPLKPDTLLESGQLYFLIPFSALDCEASPMNWANTIRKLTKTAKTTRYAAKSQSLPTRFLERGKSGEPKIGVRESCKGGKPWKPILDTIGERSFNKRSESDLQEKNLLLLNIG